MKKITLLALFLSLPAAALEWVQVRNQSDRVVARQALLFADRLEVRVGNEVEVRLIGFDEVSSLLAEGGVPKMVSLPPVFFRAAVDAGWEPLMGWQPEIAIGLYQTEERTTIRRLGTPPIEAIASKLATLVYPDEVDEIVAHRDHTSCIRAVITAEVDGCVTAPFFVAQYADRFDVELTQVGELFPLPPPVLFASPEVSDAVRLAVTSKPLGTGGRFTFVDFEANIDRDRYQTVERLLND